MIPLNCKFLNKCMELGYYTERLKIANRIPVSKDVDKTVPSYYRPISILPANGRVFEKHLKSRIVSFVNKKIIPTKNKFGLRDIYSVVNSM